MKRRHTRPVLLVTAIVALMVFAGCGTTAPAPSTAPKPSSPAASQSVAPAASSPAPAPSSAPAKPKEPLKLKVATPHPDAPETGIAIIAEARGYFKEQGLDVEFIYTKGGGDTVQAVVSGGADIGLCAGPMSIFGAIEKGADIKIVSAAISSQEVWWVTAKQSPYQTIKDLAGQKVGYSSQGSSSHMALLAILEKEGITAETVAAGSPPEQWTQAKTGQLAASTALPPQAWQIVEQEGARRVFATTDYPEFADYTYVVNFARGDSIKNKSEALKAFFRGLKKASDEARTNPEATTKAFMPNTETPEALVLRWFKEQPANKFRLQPIGGLDMTIKYAKIFKFITKDPDLKATVDLSLLPQ